MHTGASYSNHVTGDSPSTRGQLFLDHCVYTGCFISSVETLELDKKNCGGVVPFLETFYSCKDLVNFCFLGTEAENL